MQVPPRKLIMGVPGKIMGDVSPQQEQMWTIATEFYQALPNRYKETAT
jgi:hypothetical protein